MGQNSTIEWTQATWSPLRVRVRDDAAEIARKKGYTSLVQIAEKMAGHIGPHCEAVSEGCRNCYSCTNNHRCLPANGTGLPFDRRARDLVDAMVDEKILRQPLSWKQPKLIFVENQSDLFGEWHSDALIDRAFAVMALCHWHTFQVLTKRSDRLREYVGSAHIRLEDRYQTNVTVMRSAPLKGLRHLVSHFRSPKYDIPCPAMEWPLPQCWFGVSVENRGALHRIDDLRRTPAAVRFLSLEPLLEDLGTIDLTGIHWVIVGGESGPGARPMHPGWVRSIRDQCQAAGVPIFFKQWGEYSPYLTEVRSEDDRRWNVFVNCDGSTGTCAISKADEETWTNWCGEPQAGVALVERVGKKAAGAMLDGREWKEFPR